MATRDDYILKNCPTCGTDDLHAEDCTLILAAIGAYEGDDNDIVIPDNAGIEAVSGGYRVEASVYVPFGSEEQEED
jgi:hypothetical protein